MSRRKYSAIFSLRTTIGQEKNVAGALYRKATLKKLDVRSVLNFENLRGYIFVEGHPADVDAAVAGVAHLRPRIIGKVPINDLDHLLIPKPTITTINVGDIVEISNGPFKGNRAKVTQVVTGREEVKVEILDSIMIIPVTIHADYVRKLESAPQKDSNKDE